jgi:predicted nuclease of predicted toxin-antitoxin system
LSVGLYMDVHVRRAVSTALRLRSIDVLTAQEDGAAEADDAALLQRATDLGRVLVSQDADLLREAARRLDERRDFSGLVYAHQLRIAVGQMIDDLELIAKATSLKDWQAKIEYLPIGSRME